MPQVCRSRQRLLVRLNFPRRWREIRETVHVGEGGHAGGKNVQLVRSYKTLCEAVCFVAIKVDHFGYPNGE